MTSRKPTMSPCLTAMALMGVDGRFQDLCFTRERAEIGSAGAMIIRQLFSTSPGFVSGASVLLKLPQMRSTPTKFIDHSQQCLRTILALS